MMTIAEFRKLALALPDAIESSHQGHPDFRLNGRIFATLHYPAHDYGTVQISPEQQDSLVRDHPNIFSPSKGAWGRNGSTNVCLKKAKRAIVEQALQFAWDKASAAAKPKKRTKPRPIVD